MIQSHWGLNIIIGMSLFVLKLSTYAREMRNQYVKDHWELQSGSNHSLIWSITRPFQTRESDKALNLSHHKSSIPLNTGFLLKWTAYESPRVIAWKYHKWENLNSIYSLLRYLPYLILPPTSYYLHSFSLLSHINSTFYLRNP